MARKKDRTGEYKLNNQGIGMTIIAYRNCDDIDIQFDDGVILKHCYYSNFVKGRAVHPNHKSRVGETNKNNQGHIMTIIEYKSHLDITVQFEDGTIVKNRHYKSFKNGLIGHPKTKCGKIDRTGEIGIANNGERIKIIQYNNINDIIVEFENGQRVNTTYNSFKKGTAGAKNGNINRIPKSNIAEQAKNRLGEVAQDKYGHTMKIIRYNSSSDIDVQFDSGYIAKNTSYDSFLRKNIAYRSKEDIIQDRLNKIVKHKNGQNMKIISYRGHNDIDVQFEDGSIAKHKKYDCFIKGNIQHPKIAEEITNRVGKVSTANNGMKMKIIAYKNASDIDIQFEDGTIVQHKVYRAFLTGEISHPTIKTDTKRKIEDISNKEVVSTCGLKIKIIQYTDCRNVTIKFEDGTLRRNIRYSHFEIGNVAHPKYFKCEEAYEFQGEKIFICRCRKCKSKHVIPLKEMKNFECTVI